MFCKNCGKEVKSTDKFCDDCGQEVKVNKFDALRERLLFAFKKNKKAIITSFIVVVIFIVAVFLSTTYNNNEQVPNKYYDQDSVVLSVVNVFCDNDEGGSGTIMTEDGLILTNNHVISGSTVCLVGLPNETTGQLVGIYKAEPIVIPDLSEKYDLAVLSIYDSFTDDTGEKWGVYPTVFPSFSSSDNCDNYSPNLGENIVVYGYPVTSGGYNLTVTDGIISSFADDGTILTSAKIDSGNSGGLAVNKNGCFVGIPSAVVNGNYQNLGVIIPQSLIDEFINQVPSD